jgi:tetratricopeptide (TPR) repeat protein
MRAALRLVALIVGLALAAVSHAQSDDLQDISRLLKQGQHAQALERVNQYLATRPRDAQGRFMKGLILVEQNKVADAIDVFTRLSQDYPELPEPYNNLAVLYAAQGQYEKARQSLEMSIRTHPSYATAHENLGDVYTKLASQAYDRALQLDSSNSAAQTKLSLVREMILGTNRTARAAARTEPAKAAEPPKATVLAAAPKASTVGAPEAKPAAEPKGPEAKPAPVPEAKPAAGKAPEKQADKGAATSSEDVSKAVLGWAQAWSKKNVDAYLAYYARDFKTPNGEPRGEWEKARRQRITAPKHIEVSVDGLKVSAIDANSAKISFRQHYRSDSLKTDSSKTLVMVRVDGKWLIQQERVGN